MYRTKENAEIIHFEQKEMKALCFGEYSKICYIYNKKFNPHFANLKKLLHHCQFTGRYRGAAQNICNLRYSVPREISAMFQNGSN